MKIFLGVAILLSMFAYPPAQAEGDIKNGKLLYSAQCIACHSIAVSMAGPAHKGVFGRKAGSVADFEYSAALKKSRVLWTGKNLDLWLSNPEKFIPGQKMSYAVANAKEREDLIAYLKAQP
jgi:cytochrome c